MKNVKKIIEVFKKSGGNIKPHFFLTGSTGSGKTFLINYLAQLYKLPMVTINAAQLTKEGTSGSSISRLFRPLLGQTKPSIVFLDEFDKLIVGTNHLETHDYQVGVQDELLKVIEEGKVHILVDYGKYVTVDNNNLLFVLSGAFNNIIVDMNKLSSLGVSSQLIGRVPLHYHLKPLSLEKLLSILRGSSLLDNYLKLESLDIDTVLPQLEQMLTEEYIENNIGARLVNKVVHRYFIDRERVELLILEE